MRVLTGADPVRFPVQPSVAQENGGDPSALFGQHPRRQPVARTLGLGFAHASRFATGSKKEGYTSPNLYIARAVGYQPLLGEDGTFVPPIDGTEFYCILPIPSG